MKQNQKGFTVIEVVLVLLLLGLVTGGFFLIKKARHNLSNSVTSSQNATALKREQKIEGSAVAYTGQPECHQDDAALNDNVRSKGPGISVGVEHVFGKITTAGNIEADSNTPADALLTTAAATYPLKLDKKNSYLGTNRAAFVFEFVSTPKEVAVSLTKTKATISYTLKTKTYTTLPFTIDSCVL